MEILGRIGLAYEINLILEVFISHLLFKFPKELVLSSFMRNHLIKPPFRKEIHIIEKPCTGYICFQAMGTLGMYVVWMDSWTSIQGVQKKWCICIHWIFFSHQAIKKLWPICQHASTYWLFCITDVFPVFNCLQNSGF